jgi:hypothetical protein
MKNKTFQVRREIKAIFVLQEVFVKHKGSKFFKDSDL